MSDDLKTKLASKIVERDNVLQNAQADGCPVMALQGVADNDVLNLAKAHMNYGTSWKKRGGVGAFMMLARKWDRLEKAVEAMSYNIFDAIEKDRRAEGIMDDIRDLRRYLMLVEAEIGARHPEVKKD